MFFLRRSLQTSIINNVQRTANLQNIVLPNIYYMASNQILNPIPAGVLENQDMLGGGQFDPPSNPMFDVQI